jgi:hypothetical protein
MAYEATHQLNDLVAHLALPQWLDEGLACYISTSRISGDSLHLGEVAVHTYPVWWLESIALSGDLDADKKNACVIPLRAIISGQHGPRMSTHVNLYYLHWWSLAHFLMNYENGKYRAGLSQFMASDESVFSFEKYIGEIDTVKKQWYGYFSELKRNLAK